jgi:CrcB protein
VLRVAVIAAARAVGTALRYLLALGAQRWLGASLPWGTLAANVLGSLLLGAVVEAAGDRTLAGIPAKLVLGTGLLGGFTTYSSFNLEALHFFEQGAWSRGLAYVAGTLALCLLAGAAGLALARSLRG